MIELWYIGTQAKPDPEKDIKLTSNSGYCIREDKNIYCVDTPKEAIITFCYGNGSKICTKKIRTGDKISDLFPNTNWFILQIMFGL